jgi:hypothetical protein
MKPFSALPQHYLSTTSEKSQRNAPPTRTDSFSFALPHTYIKGINIMRNINSIDQTVLTVFKRELECITALNIPPAVVEYLAQRVSEIEGPPSGLSDV